MSAPCCESFDERYGCHHEICPGCYCSKGHEQNVCDGCHEYNLRIGHEPYLEKYGRENLRKAA